MKTRTTTTTLFLIALFLFCLNINAQWEVVEETATTDTLNGVFMVSSTVWAVGNNGSVIKSTDAGKTWTKLDSGISGDLEDVYFHNENNGIAVGIEGIFQTQDGGQSWSQYEIENSTHLEELSFADENKGAAITIAGSVFLTSDGGVSWVQGSPVAFSTFWATDIEFVNDSVAYITETAGDIFKTTNGGELWNQIKAGQGGDLFGDLLQGVSFFDENTGIVGGSNSFSTSDGGLNWNEVSTYLASSDVQFVNSQLCFSVGLSGKIFKSLDTGQSWTEQESKTDATLNSVFFSDENLGIAVGDDGIIVRTENGGVTSVNSEDKVPAEFNLAQNYPNPFNPSTTISYSIPKQSKVSLKIYDMLGSEIAELVNEEKAVGSYEVNFDASNLSSGIYFYTLKTNNSVLTKKMTLIK